jgi:hypothetical protein
MVQTYQGVIEQGTVRLSSDADLPDGTRVYVTAIPTLDERYARRKAAAWLAENVGDQLMPGAAMLARQGQRLVWSFPVLLGSPFDEPSGPLGYVEVDAEAGSITSGPALAEELLRNAEHLAASPLPSRN